MSIDRRTLVTWSLLAFVAVTAATLAVKEVRRSRAVAAAEAARPAEAATRLPASARTVVVTYYHATARCASCLRIEDLTQAAVTTRLAAPLAEKRLVWRTVNTDEPENARFVKDYGLYTKSVIVSEVKDGREVRWKNLDQVWKLLGEPDAFQGYVEREVRAFLEPA